MRQRPFPSLVLLSAGIMGCGSSVYSWLDQSGRHGGGGSGGGGGGAVEELSNDDVFRRLTPSCEGCHGAGAGIPSFSSLAAFENLIAYNPSVVTIGSPDASELVRLLEGTSTTGRQMPPSPSAKFADLAARGQTRLSMAQIRHWISRLQQRVGDGTAARDAVTLRRKTAEEAIETLKDQLGLSESDFLLPAGGTPNEPYLRTIDIENYAIRSPDSPGIIIDYDTATRLRFLSLGGPNYLNNRKRSRELSPTFLQTWIPLSQAWCRTAVEKQNNSTFFREAALDDSSDNPTGRQRIRNNIAYLHLQMLGEYPMPEDIDDLMNNIFLHYLTSGTQVVAEQNKVPWTAVCAALAQDPLALTY